jgi:uncharacterized protein YegL
MILLSNRVDDEIEGWANGNGPISDDAAQTIASWWYSPRQTAMVAFATAGVVDAPALLSEVRALVPAPDQAQELKALIEWIEAQP